MSLRSYEIRGHYYETESREIVKFICYVPPCCNAYAAKQYVIDKLTGNCNMDIVIDSITRTIGSEVC